MDEIVKEFLVETHDNLTQLDLDFVTLEKNPTERETLGRVFRTVHNIKGVAGFLSFTKMEAVAHAGENLLSRLRDGKLVLNPEIASALLATVDAIRRMLSNVEATQQEGEGDYSQLIETLHRLQNVESPAAAVDPPPQAVTADPPAAKSSPSKSSVNPGLDTPGSPLKAEAETSEARTAVGSDSAAASAVSDSTIRVDVGLLDKLMTLVGELVLARNQILQYTASQEDSAFLGTTQRLNLITTELQAGVMKTRLQPIGNVWSKFPRIVRDLSVACGKQVRLDMEGQDTELDKTIIEALRDPLTHLVRNAVDHGIEPPQDRLKRGKSSEGRLYLRAYHEGGKVNIEMTDDGGGIDPQRVRDKAIHSKLISPEQAARIGDREALNLIFLPGFSTAAKVTNVSGRGVGMDVVRTNIEKIGGTVDIQSEVGVGTTIKMKIPLTLAIIPALTVTSGGDRYAIPQVSLLELVRLEGEQAEKGIELIHGVPVYRLRGHLLPLVYLGRELGLSESVEREAWSVEREASRERKRLEESLSTQHSALSTEIHMVVLQADDRQFGLVVNGIHDTEEIVVKPLQKQLKGIGVFSGATIMGDGRVALILDVMGLAQRANVISGARERALGEEKEEAEAGAGAADRQTVLLFAAPDGGRMAIPLSLVARLEEFPRSIIEKAGARNMIQYRGEILPLIHVSQVLAERRSRPRAAKNGQKKPSADGDTIQVVVYSGKEGRAGLVVGRILDVVEEAIVAKSHSSREGVLFTAVIQGRVTEFLDVEGIIRMASGAGRGATETVKV